MSVYKYHILCVSYIILYMHNLHTGKILFERYRYIFIGIAGQYYAILCNNALKIANIYVPWP